MIFSTQKLKQNMKLVINYTPNYLLVVLSKKNYVVSLLHKVLTETDLVTRIKLIAS